MDVQRFKYFIDPQTNASFTDENCQCCGAEKNCLDGDYFDRGAEITSVCLNCLENGRITVEISEYIQKKLFSHLQDTFTQKNEEQLNELFKSILHELQKTPPVPWIQYNDWPVADGDCMQYIGEWGQEDFVNHAPDGHGKDYAMSILDEWTKSKIDDSHVFWDDIGNYTTIFVFKSVTSSTIVGVAQSY